jgi:hypothetical protein
MSKLSQILESEGLTKEAGNDARKAVREAFAELKRTQMAYLDKMQGLTEGLIAQAVAAERGGDRSKLWDPSDRVADAEELMDKARRKIPPDTPTIGGQYIARMSESELEGVFSAALRK